MFKAPKLSEEANKYLESIAGCKIIDDKINYLDLQLKHYGFNQDIFDRMQNLIYWKELHK